MGFLVCIGEAFEEGDLNTSASYQGLSRAESYMALEMDITTL